MDQNKLSVPIFFLIENMMGFETPVETGNKKYVESKKRQYEQEPATRTVGSKPYAFAIKARYYIVHKDEWVIHNCPLIPVDLS